MARSLPSIAEEIERYLRTGDTDTHARAWPGDVMERGRRQHADLRGALVEEVRRLATGRSHEPVPANVGVEFTRAKVEPMVRGLFPRAEQDAVLATFEKSVVYVTSDTIEPIILQQMWDRSRGPSRTCTSSVSARSCSGKRAARIVGMSEETTCYVSPEYFAEDDPFADFIVHEAAHIFHNCKRRTVGLRETRRKEWLLDIEFTRARDLRLLVRGVRAHRRAREEPRRAPGAGGRVRLGATDLGGARGPGRGGEHRRRGRERAERLEGDPGAVRADQRSRARRWSSRAR